MFKSKKAFTLIELLVVIAIIGILATVSIISLSNARAKSRDAKRAGDMKQVQTALELFFNDKNRYPTAEEFALGSVFSTSTTGTSTYLQIVPDAPTPVDGSCTSGQNDFYYSQTDNGNSYTISFCLGNTTGTLDSGPKCLTPGGIADADCSYCPSTITYESEEYPAVLIGNQCWLAKNLNVGDMVLTGASEPECHTLVGLGPSCQVDPNVTEKYCYQSPDGSFGGDSAKCAIYGGLYEWAEAMGFPYECNAYDFTSGSSNCGTANTYTIASEHQGVCPTGWHVPTVSDMDTLVSGLDGYTYACTKLKNSAPWNGTNSSGFNFLYAGIRYLDGRSSSFGSFGMIWLSTPVASSVTASYQGSCAWAAELPVYGYNRIVGNSIRCIKN